MVMILFCVVAILYISIELQDRLRIPTPLSLIILSFALHLVAHKIPLIMANPTQYAHVILLLLPILLISDSLELDLDDLKQHGLSLFYLAVVTVTLSVIIAIFTAGTIFNEHNLTIPATIVLFAMVLATDPVSVVSIFSSFELPHRLKILAEGESLFNDATALIVFVFIGLFALTGGDLSVAYVLEISVFVILGSLVLGIFVGYVILMLMKLTTNRTSELLLLIIGGYGAFEIAEHFYILLNYLGAHSHMHLSGILSCITTTVIVNHILTREMIHEDQMIGDKTERGFIYRYVIDGA